MGREKQRSGEIVTKYLGNYPNMSSLGLARLICQENPLDFNGVEHARNVVRHYRGSIGAKALNMLTDRRFVGQSGEIPEPIKESFEPYTLPLVDNNVLVLSDIHFPFQDKEALVAAVMEGKEHKVKTVLLNGDIVDMYEMSKFDKVPSFATFIEEREQFWKFLDYLNTHLPNVHVIYKEGNHEERFQRYMMRKAPEVYGITEFSIPFLFDLRVNGVTWVDNKQEIYAGKLAILHGHEYMGGSSNTVNPARWLYLKAQYNALCGHFHKDSHFSGKTIEDKYIGTWTTGCLCYLKPKYMPHNQWKHGFAIVEVKDNGNFKVHNKQVIDGKIY